MRFSHRYRFVFLATPRTASTSVRDALDECSDVRSVYRPQVDEAHPYYHHISARELKARFDANGWRWSDYRSACFVRNPYDRVVSLYHHYLEKGSRTAPGKSAVFNGARALRYRLLPLDSFDKFVRKLDVDAVLPRPVSDFSADENGECLIDDILRFEELPGCFIEWTTRCDLPIPPDRLPALNGSRARRGYREYYDDDTREIVSRKYANDLSRFGYTF